MRVSFILLAAMLLFTAPAAVLYGQSPETVPRGNPSFGYDPRPEYQQRPASPARLCPSSLAWLQGEPEPAIPNLSDAGAAPNIPAAQPEQIDAALPINLATAMRLSSARPLVIQAAIASEMTSYGRVQQAQVLWLPDLILGSDYQRHDGGQQRAEGEVSINDRNQFLTGGGLKAIFALADAIYEPLSAKQLYRARNYDVQAAKNDALLDMTDAYFLVQQSRGVLAGDEDAVAKGRELLKTVQSLSQGLAAPIEVQRAQTTLAELEQRATTARQDWRINSANLTRVLRLNPAAVIVPLEPPQLQVTIVSPEKSVDELIPEGLLTRPELASQKAVVQATIARLKQERMRPLIPSLVVQGSANPGDTLGAGFYEANVTGANPISTGRSDWDFQVVWELQNLGAGNAGLVHERMGEERQAMVELFRVQDRVAAEIVQAQAQVIAAAARIKQAEYGLASAEASFKGNLKGLSETIQVGQQLELVIRPQEVTAALLQLQQAYSDYYTSINDYNRAEFRLYHALGFPAQQMTCNPGWGDPQPTNCQRPPEMGSSAVATVYRPTEHR